MNETLTGINNKVPLQLETENLHQTPTFLWAWAYTDTDGILKNESMMLSCKDHLIDCLQHGDQYRPLRYIRHTTKDTPITLILLVNATKNDPMAGIKNLVHPLEQQNKWKQTQIVYLDKYIRKNVYRDTIYFHAYKITASKMWKRNGFLFSIWASLVRIGWNYPEVTLDNWIDTLTKLGSPSYCNEVSYLKSNTQYYTIESYKKTWDYVLNNLHKYKKLYNESVHTNTQFKGYHGVDGIFWCLGAAYNHVGSGYCSSAKKSHPFLEDVTQHAIKHSISKAA